MNCITVDPALEAALLGRVSEVMPYDADAVTDIARRAAATLTRLVIASETGAFSDGVHAHLDIGGYQIELRLPDLSQY